MGYARKCPYCGAYLDPGESCDCQEKAIKESPETRKCTQDLDKHETSISHNNIFSRRN